MKLNSPSEIAKSAIIGDGIEIYENKENRWNRWLHALNIVRLGNPTNNDS